MGDDENNCTFTFSTVDICDNYSNDNSDRNANGNDITMIVVMITILIKLE